MTIICLYGTQQGHEATLQNLKGKKYGCGLSSRCQQVKRWSTEVSHNSTRVLSASTKRVESKTILHTDLLMM